MATATALASAGHSVGGRGLVGGSGPLVPHASDYAAALQRQSNQAQTRYTKGELLGRGACKTVYKAFDEEEGLEVAWNEITVSGEFASVQEKERERIFGEIRLLQQLKHKNILALHDWWFDKKNSSIVFITELFMDGSLRSYRRKHKNVDSHVFKRWAWQILQGLVYLHGHNPPIIHRDLKSDNILMNGASGTLKIGDLGFATFRAGFSGAMSVIGTPEFMAPELYEEKYDEKVDIYSFGMCLMELATLEYPYSECRNAAQIFKKVTAGVAPQGLSRINDDELRDFVMLCIRHDPAQRPEARQLLKHPFFEAIRAEGARKPPIPLPPAASTGALQMLSSPPPSGVLAVSPPLQSPMGTARAAGAGAGAAADGTPGMVTPGTQPPAQPVAATLAAAAAALGLARTSTNGTDPQQGSAGGASSNGGGAAGPLRFALSRSESTGMMGGATGTAGEGEARWAHGLLGMSSVPGSQGAGGGGLGAAGTSPMLQGPAMMIANALMSSAGGNGNAGGGGAGTVAGAGKEAAAAQTPFGNSGGGSGVVAGAPQVNGHFSPPENIPPSRRGTATRLSTGQHSELGELGDDVLLYNSSGGGADETSTQGGASTPPHSSGTPRSSLGGVSAHLAQLVAAGHGAWSPSTKLALQRSRDCHAIQEDSEDESGGPGEMESRVRLACRNHDDNMLAFSMSFVNHQGTRKKVGFQYDMAADTATEVAGEMIENLSLNTHEAGFIASLIQREISRFGRLNNPAGVLGQAAAATAVIGPNNAAAAIGAVAAVAAAAAAAPGVAAVAAAVNSVPRVSGSGAQSSPPTQQQQGWGESARVSGDGRPPGAVEGTASAPVPVPAGAPPVSALTQGLARSQGSATLLAIPPRESQSTPPTPGAVGAWGQQARYGQTQWQQQQQQQQQPLQNSGRLAGESSQHWWQQQQLRRAEGGQAEEEEEEQEEEEDGEGEEPSCFF